MSDSDTRPSMSPSLSFAGSSSASTVSRPLKRRFTSDTSLFTPSATSFNPRPYTPPTSSREYSVKSCQSTRNNRSGMGSQPVSMDPGLSDPNVLFIHPPFTIFPGAEEHPEGLTYAILAANPEWFLDPIDFISERSTNPDAIVYPSELEPPRGWCPAKKRDLKERGADGWPEGEEPRLRCTFCRRTYAGVNAKSMWRRHVFERHKIAMANRRESSGKPRGRGYNKENRLVDLKRHNAHEGVVNFELDHQPRSPTRAAAPKSKFHSLMPVNGDCSAHRALQASPSTPRIPQAEFPASPEYTIFPRPHPLSQCTLPPASPPLTPQTIQVLDHSVPPGHRVRLSSSPPPVHPVIPPSPYNPLQTPSFRHSPPRLPSDQPWRYPSPSHPLHSKASELCLSMLAPDNGSPSIKATPKGGASSTLLTHRTPFHSPNLLSGKTRMRALETPESLVRLSQISPGKLFSEKPLKFGLHIGIVPERMRHPVEESPLAKSSRRLLTASKSLGTPSRNLLTPPSSDVLDAKAILADHDPFAAIWEPAMGLLQDRHTPPLSSPEVDSPVVRRRTLQEGAADISNCALVGLGIGLLEPFRLPDDGSDFDDSDSDFVESPLAYPSPSIPDETRDETEEVEKPFVTPPTKRRKIAGAV